MFARNVIELLNCHFYLLFSKLIVIDDFYNVCIHIFIPIHASCKTLRASGDKRYINAIAIAIANGHIFLEESGQLTFHYQNR